MLEAEESDMVAIDLKRGWLLTAIAQVRWRGQGKDEVGSSNVKKLEPELSLAIGITGLVIGWAGPATFVSSSSTPTY